MKFTKIWVFLRKELLREKWNSADRAAKTLGKNNQIQPKKKLIANNQEQQFEFALKLFFLIFHLFCTLQKLEV